MELLITLLVLSGIIGMISVGVAVTSWIDARSFGIFVSSTFQILFIAIMCIYILGQISTY